MPARVPEFNDVELDISTARNPMTSHDVPLREVRPNEI
jgi:hypothetical protein